jgi:hypothetical protein
MMLIDLLHCERVRKKKEVETPMGKPGTSTGMSLRLASQALIQSELKHQLEEKEQKQAELSRTSSNSPVNEKSAEKKNDAENEENVNTSANREDEVIESLDAVLENDQDHVQGDASPGNMDDSGSCGSVSGSGQKVQMQMSHMSPSAAFKLDFAIEETLEAGQKILAEFSQDMSLLNESWVNSPVVHPMIPHREGESPDFAREDTSSTPTHNVRVPHRAPPKTPGQPSPELQTSRIVAVSVSAANETNKTETKTRNKQVIVSEKKDEIERERLWEVQTQTRQLWQADRQLQQKANSFFSTTLYSARMLKVVEALKKQKQKQKEPVIDQRKEDRMQTPQKVQDKDIEPEPEPEMEMEMESYGSSKKVTPNKSSPWFVAARKSLSPEKCHPADATLSAWDPVVQHVLKGAATSPHRQKEQKERKAQANYHRPLSYDWLHIPGGVGEYRASPKAATLTLLELTETPPQQFSQVSAAHSWLEARLHGIIDSLHGQLTEVVIPALKAELWSADMQSRMAPFLCRLQAVLSVCYEVWSFLVQQPPATTTTTVELQFPWKWCQSWQGLWIHLGIWSLHCQHWSIYLMEWESSLSFDRRQRLRQLLGEFAPDKVHSLWQWSMIPLLLLEQLPLFWEAYSRIALLPVSSLVPVGRLVASSQRWQSAFAPSLRQQTSLLKMSALLPLLRVPTQLLSLYPSLQSSWPPMLVCQVTWENAPEDRLPVAKGDTLRLIAHLQEGILGLAVPLPLNRDRAMESDHPNGDSHGQSDNGDKRNWEWVAIAHVGKDNNSMEKWPLQVGENPWQLILLPQRWRTVRAEINGHLQSFDGRDNNAREKEKEKALEVEDESKSKSNVIVRRDGYLSASVLGEVAPLSGPDWLQACEEWYEAKAAAPNLTHNLSWPSGYETWQQWDAEEDPRLWEGLPQIPAGGKGEATRLAPLVPLVAESPPLTITPPLCYQGLRQLQHLVDLALTQHPSHTACLTLAQTLQAAEERWKKDTATSIDNNQKDDKEKKKEKEKEKLLPEMVPVDTLPDHHPSPLHRQQPPTVVLSQPQPQPQTQLQTQTQTQPMIVESSIEKTMPQQRENEKKKQEEEEDAKGEDLVFVSGSDGQTDTIVGQGDIVPLPPTTWQSIRTASRHRKQQAAALEEEEQAQTTENRQSNDNGNGNGNDSQSIPSQNDLHVLPASVMERMRARPLVEGRGRTRTLVAYALPLPPGNAQGHSSDTHQVTPPQTLEQRFSLSIAAGLPPRSSQRQSKSKTKSKRGGAQRPLMTQRQRRSLLDNDTDTDTDTADSNSALALSRGDDDSENVRERVREKEEEEVSHGSGSERMLPSEGASFISSDDADESSESGSPMAAPAKPAPLPPSSHPVVPLPLTRPPPPPPDDDEEDEEDVSF